MWLHTRKIARTTAHLNCCRRACMYDCTTVRMHDHACSECPLLQVSKMPSWVGKGQDPPRGSCRVRSTGYWQFSHFKLCGHPCGRSVVQSGFTDILNFVHVNGRVRCGGSRPSVTTDRWSFVDCLQALLAFFSMTSYCASEMWGASVWLHINLWTPFMYHNYHSDVC